MSTTASRAFRLEEFGPPEVMRLVHRPMPEPGPGEVLVAVEVSGVNFADTMIRRGEYLRDQPLSMAPGSEVVGRVIGIGAGVSLRLGTRVAGWVEAGGAYADHVLVPEHRAYPVSEELPGAAIAALFLQGTTAEYAIHRFGRTQPGETVLVHAAAGGVGGLAVQLAKLAGARVVATASSAAKLEVAREHGADAVVDASDSERFGEQLEEACGDRGCDVVVDGVGGRLFEPSLRCLAFGGRYVVVGAASQEPSVLDARRLLVRAQTVCGFILARITEQDPGEPGRSLANLSALVEDSRLRPSYEVLALDQAVEAHRRIEARGVTGKLVLAAASTELQS
jgi:NADPH2:quinone reductase